MVSGSATFAATMANITKQLARGRQLSRASLCFFKLVAPQQKATSLLTFELCFTACQQRTGWVESREVALPVLTQCCCAAREGPGLQLTHLVLPQVSTAFPGCTFPGSGVVPGCCKAAANLELLAMLDFSLLPSEQQQPAGMAMGICSAASV